MLISQHGHVEMYVGIDLCADMVEVARERFRNRPNMRFETGDMAQLELRRRGIPPCDLYYSSYGGPSHLKDEDMVKMLTEIAGHMRGHAVVVVDLLGQFSPEWPNYWGYSNKPGVEKLQPYNMSWLYPPEEQDGRVDEFSDYPMSPSTVLGIQCCAYCGFFPAFRQSERQTQDLFRHLLEQF